MFGDLALGRYQQFQSTPFHNNVVTTARIDISKYVVRFYTELYVFDEISALFGPYILATGARILLLYIFLNGFCMHLSAWSKTGP